jgi:hypothetical protein
MWPAQPTQIDFARTPRLGMGTSANASRLMRLTSPTDAKLRSRKRARTITRAADRRGRLNDGTTRRSTRYRALSLALGGWANSSVSMAETVPEVQAPITEAPRRDPLVGVGFHAGNFIGPLAFEVIIRPLPHIALDLQAGYWSSDIDAHGLAVAPQLQWEFRRGWRSTPYAGLAFRYEEDWLDGVSATSKGGFLVGGWQFRWQSGFGVLLGGGVLYMTSVALNTPGASHWASGGWFGTYEVGVRYFF